MLLRFFLRPQINEVGERKRHHFVLKKAVSMKLMYFNPVSWVANSKSGPVLPFPVRKYCQRQHLEDFTRQHHFYCKLQNLWCSDVFMGYRKELVASTR